MKQKILQFVEGSGDGVTSRDIAPALHCPRALVRRYLGELKNEGLIFGTGEYRDGAAVVAMVPQLVLEMA